MGASPAEKVGEGGRRFANGVRSTRGRRAAGRRREKVGEGRGSVWGFFSRACKGRGERATSPRGEGSVTDVCRAETRARRYERRVCDVRRVVRASVALLASHTGLSARPRGWHVGRSDAGGGARDAGPGGGGGVVGYPWHALQPSEGTCKVVVNQCTVLSGCDARRGRVVVRSGCACLY